MKQNTVVEIWLGRPYAWRIEPLAEVDGGGYMAWVPQFGRHTLTGDGETPEEALASLREVLRLWFARLAERGEEPPEPLPAGLEPDDYPSGKLNLRLPRSLHYELARAAERDGISLNQHIVALLATRHGEAEGLRRAEEMLRRAAAGQEWRLTGTVAGGRPAAPALQLIEGGYLREDDPWIQESMGGS